MSSMLDILTSVLDSASAEAGRLYEPIPARDFFLSEYFTGLPRKMIPEFWLEHSADFCDGGYNEMIVTGSIGSLKTTWANLIIMRKFYELFSLKDINNYFGIPSIQDIYNIYFNISMQQAHLTGFRQLKNMIDESKWFTENFPRNKNLNTMIDFPNQPTFKYLSGSGSRHAIGMTMWSFILDEGDFFKKGGGGFDESFSGVTEMYGELVDRRKSRFQNGEIDLSFSILISSASFQSSFVQKRIEEAASDKRVKVVKAVRYKVLPERFSDRRFVVFIGDAMMDPSIIKEPSDYDIIFSKLSIDYKVDPEKDVLAIFDSLPYALKIKFEDPPVDLKDRFDKNLGKSLQNFCGHYIAAEGKLFQSKSLLFSAYSTNLSHPFSKEQIEISNGDNVAIKDYFFDAQLTDLSKPHALHLDGAITGDSYGISMVRYDGSWDNKRHYTQVFSLEILPPPPPYRIKLSKVRDFVIYLFEEVQVNIALVTQDMHNSEDNLQLLADKGISVARQSIDRSDKPYLSWIGLLVDGSISMYKYRPLEEEAFGAIHLVRKAKVVHPEGKGQPNINVLQSFVGALNNLASFDLNNIPTSDYNLAVAESQKDLASDFKERFTQNKYVDNPFMYMRGKNKTSAFSAIIEG